MPFLYIDSYYIFLVLPALLIAGWASINVKTTFNKYNQMKNARGLTGYDVARRILDYNELSSIKIEHVTGNLSDHYDPKSGVVRLSDATYSSTSVGAIGVAAHEVGHAIQHQNGYLPMKVRSAIVPITQFGSMLAWPLAILGIVLSFQPLITIGIWLFVAVVVFQLVTLPVEYNASGRAMKSLEAHNILNPGELGGARKVLNAAALTYVAALIVAIANLVRLLALANRRRN